MAFHEVRFPAWLSFGSTGGPERRTDVVTLANGYEERATPWAASRRRFDAGTGLRSLDDMAALIAFFEERRGRLHGFRWKDWSDHRSGVPSEAPGMTDQVLGVADGATRDFALVKHYGQGPGRYTRRIDKPVAGTVVVAVEGVPMREGADFALDTVRGVVTLDQPPVAGASVTAGFEFDVPVRFDIDRIDVSVANYQAGEAPHVPVIEVRL
ncbi:TIGR02217 family protein [Palleronia sediminis]|uniref:TIGR02217 family protein n=1 Tax=Palleronia sediminis TaxID=2547833 RepID=A0A4V3B9K6_9RHOB|nr:DUF2460 domain-containing protein [Palleronia sediminis]TDL79559.1 TIGR02217 family protein [Palleronia sediminis]